MPAGSREKSPKVGKIFGRTSSCEPRIPKGNQGDAAALDTATHPTTPTTTITTTSTSTTTTTTTPSTPTAVTSPTSVVTSVFPSAPGKTKKSKRGFLPYLRGHRSSKKEAKEECKKKEQEENDDVLKDIKHKCEEELKLDTSDSENIVSPPNPFPPKADPLPATPDSGGKGAQLQNASNDGDGGEEGKSQQINDGGKVSVIPRPSSQPAIKSPLHKLQTLQRSFLHNRFGSAAQNSVAAPHQGASTLRPTTQPRPVAAQRYHTLGHSTQPPQEGVEEVFEPQEGRYTTLNDVRARLYNHVSNLTYEGVEFSGVEGAGLNLASCSATTSTEKHTVEDKCAKLDVKKLLLKSLLQEDAKGEAEGGDSLITVDGNRTVKAKLNITVVKTPEAARRGRPGSLRGRGSQRRRRALHGNASTTTTTTTAAATSVPTTVTPTITTTPTSINSNMTTSPNVTSIASVLTTCASTTTNNFPTITTTTKTTSITSLSTTLTTATTTTTKPVLLRDGVPIPEYAKVHKRKKTHPNVLMEGEDEEDEEMEGNEGNGVSASLCLPTIHSHESPVEKAPVIKKIESAGYKSRKDMEATLKVNPVRRVESFKTGGRVVRRSSLSYTSRAKVMEGESSVKTQAVNLRRKDSKNGRLDLMKGARKAEYRLSVTIKPSTVAALTDKFNTMISQNQSGPQDVPQVTLHKTRIPPLAPRVGTVHKTRQKFVRLDKEGAAARVLTEKSRKEEKNREQQRGVAGLTGVSGGESILLSHFLVNRKHRRSPNTRSPNARSPNTRSPYSRSPNAKSPNSRSPNTRSPNSRSPNARSPNTRSPIRSPNSRSPNARSPNTRSPIRSPNRSPNARSPNTRSPIRSPNRPPNARSPNRRSPTARSPNSRSPITTLQTDASPSSLSPTRATSTRSPIARPPVGRVTTSRSPSPSSPRSSPSVRRLPASRSRSPPMRSARPRAVRRRGVARQRSSTGMGDNKTDEEKVCEKIKTALSSSKFKGESEDEEISEDSEDENEEKCQRDTEREQSPPYTSIEISASPSSALFLCAAKAVGEGESVGHLEGAVGGVPSSGIHAGGHYPTALPERHTKSDSLDSGISTDGYQLSPKFRATSISGHTSPLPEDCSLDTVASSDTFRSEDSAVALRGVEDAEEKDLQQEKDISVSLGNKVEEEEDDYTLIFDSDEKGMIDLMESENKETEEYSTTDTLPSTAHESKPFTSHTQDSAMETPKSAAEGGQEEEEERQLEVDSRSVESSGQDDLTSEVSSVCSEAKGKKEKPAESRIYSAVKSAVKNTVKKTKEKDAERKEERERRNRSPSADREKWYRRGRSRERRDKKKEEEECPEGVDSEKEREGRTYDRFNFKKLREKSLERKKAKEEKKKDDDKNEISEDAKEGKCKKKEDKEESVYGRWTLRSRSRSRDKKKHKEKIMEQIAKEERGEEEEQEGKERGGGGVPIDPLCTSTSLHTFPGSSLTLPPSLKKSQDTSVFTFDTESLYSQVLSTSTSSHSMTLPPPPKTPLPSPPSSATLIIPPPPNTPIPDPPTEASGAGQGQKDGLHASDKDKGGGESDSSADTENIYENLYTPNMEKLLRNREKLEGRGIRPNSSFLWSEGGKQLPNNSRDPVAELQEALTEVVNEEDDEEPERSPFTRQPGVRNYCRYGKTALAGRFKDHNYAELTQRGGAAEGYDGIGAASSVSYDDVGAPPSSCGYDDVRAPSNLGYDTIQTPSEGYDPVNPPRSDSSQYDDCDGGVVTARFAVVREDQLDSISYMYDEVAMYNASLSSHSYEPVCPPSLPIPAPTLPTFTPAPPTVPSIQEVPESPLESSAPPLLATTDGRSDEGSEDGSDGGVHEVFSYKLTRIGSHSITTTTTTTTKTSTPSTSSSSTTTTHRLPPSPPTTHAPPTPTIRNTLTSTTTTTTTTTNTTTTDSSRARGRHGAAVPPPLTFAGVGAGVEGRGRLPSPSHSPTETSADEWVDVSDSETDDDDDDIRAPISITTQIPLLRVRQRSNLWRPRYWKKSWSQAAHQAQQVHYNHHHNHHHNHNHHNEDAEADADDEPEEEDEEEEEEKEDEEKEKEKGEDRLREEDKKKSLREGGGEESGQEQEQEQGDDEEEEDDPAGGHYEAIYEVINPANDEDDDYPPRHDDPDFDDSFDSDDSENAYCRLRPQYPDEEAQDVVGCDETPPLCQRNPDGSTARHHTLPQPLHQHQLHQQQQHGITKIAEAANLGMRRLRRNWSHTKNEVRTGLNKIKKKGTFSASDIKSTENLASSDMSPNSEEKRKWSFKSHFKRKSSTGSLTALPGSAPPLPPKKESATFYLTLTIEAGAQDAGELSDASQPNARSDAESVTSRVSGKEVRHSNTPSIASVTTLASSDSVSARRPQSAAYSRKNSTGSNSGGPVRPRTAPPAPPPKDKSSEKTSGACERERDGEELSKTEVASRLNQLLSCGPVAPPGRRVLRTSGDSSSDASPVPVLVHPDDAGYTGLRLNAVKYATIDAAASSLPGGDSSGDERVLGAEAMSGTGLHTPRARTSVASSGSHGSSEGYIRVGDIASAPPPLPARRNPPAPLGPKPARSQSTPGLLHLPSVLLDGDNNSYLDFSVNALIQDEPLYVSSHFADEPLYQFYNAGVLERAAHNQGDCSSEDDYEVINDGQGGAGGKLQSRPSAMELVTPVDGRRTLWCELPEVVESGILNQFSSQERKIQEAMFEMITSEASYLKSLNVLVTHFVQCREFIDEGEDAVLSRRERHILFSDILPVKRCSELFLADLEKRWQESVKISNVADIICKHANNHFQVYVKYCSNQVYQDRTLKELKENNPRFLEVLNTLESSPVCQSLAMHSFLMLPMQRITRLPLLVDAIFHRLEHNTPLWHEYKVALATLTKIVAECNEGARRMERMEEMLILSRQLDFREVKAIPLISASRWLVKKGELTRLTWRENDAKLTFGKRIFKCTLYFFLFTDLLVVTKKKSEDQYMVLDFCSRNMVQVLELDTADKFPGRLLDGHKNLLIMTMLQNHENKTVEMIVSCPMESDRTRWVEAVTPRSSENPDERIYEEWDCPQVQAIHPYIGKQADELSLEMSDVVNVLKKMSDGWYHGERIRDQERGWFPGRFTVEISSTHKRARNLRQRYRLLAISGSFLDELKKEKERFEKEERKKDRRRTLTIKEVISSQAQAIS